VRRAGLDSTALGFLQGLKGYDSIVRATQFCVQIDMVTQEPIDAGSVEQALFAAMRTEAFGIRGVATVTARAVVAK
jgi:hypothetical protein